MVKIKRLIMCCIVGLLGISMASCSKHIVPKHFYHNRTTQMRQKKQTKDTNDTPKHMITLHGNAKSESFFVSGASEPTLTSIYSNLNQQSDNYINHIKNFKQYQLTNSQFTSKDNSTYYVKTIQLTRK